MEPLVRVRQLIDRRRKKKRNLATVFVDLEKAYNKVYRGGIVKDDEEKERVNDLCKNNTRGIHDEATTRVKSVWGKTEYFKAKVGVRRRST